MMDFGPMTQGLSVYRKASLSLTEAQTAAWSGYANAVKVQVLTMQGMHTVISQTMQSGDALERLETLPPRRRNTWSKASRLCAPVPRGFDKTLSDDQKKKADPSLGMSCCMM